MNVPGIHPQLSWFGTPFFAKSVSGTAREATFLYVLSKETYPRMT